MKDTIIDPEWEREQQERLKRTLRGRDADVSDFGEDQGDYDFSDEAGRGVLKSVRRRKGDDVSFEGNEIAPWDEPVVPEKKPSRGKTGDSAAAEMSSAETDAKEVKEAHSSSMAGDGLPGAGQESLPEPHPRKPSKIKEYAGSILSGNILSRAEVRKLYPYLLFVAFLMLLYISNVFRMQQLHKRHDQLVREVKELRAKSLTISAIRVNSTRQSAVLDEIKARGMDLRESVVPPKVIGK